MSIVSFKAVEKYEAQGDFLQRCVDLAKCYKTHIILVLHPNKEYRKGCDLDLEHISGTMDLANKADNVIAVIREYDQDKINMGINGKIALIKNRFYPDLTETSVHFDKETGMLAELKDGTCVAYRFSWEKYLSGNYSHKQKWIQEEIKDFEDCPF